MRRIFSAGCRTCSPSVARLLVVPFRARDRHVFGEDRRTSEPAFHVRLFLAEVAFASSVIRSSICQQDLCRIYISKERQLARKIIT